MQDIILSKKPLVEAIFELRWQLQDIVPGVSTDPHYKLLVGRIFEKIKDDYPFHQPLPFSTMPDEFAAFVVQHQFRAAKEKWPLVQIGPGIVTLNETEGYIWSNFQGRVSGLLGTLLESYPTSENQFKPISLLLRYIEAVDFSFENENVLSFIGDKLKTSIKVYDKLFGNTGVQDFPINLDLRFSFRLENPKGVAHLRFTRGKRKDADALVWETQVQSLGSYVPEGLEGIKKWVDESHALSRDWFFKMIEGELLERFK